MRIIAALILAVAAIAGHAAVDQSQVMAYRALIDQDLRLATTGYRLALANAAYCDRKERNSGWVIHDVAQMLGAWRPAGGGAARLADPLRPPALHRY